MWVASRAVSLLPNACSGETTLLFYTHHHRDRLVSSPGLPVFIDVNTYSTDIDYSRHSVFLAPDNRLLKVKYAFNLETLMDVRI